MYEVYTCKLFWNGVLYRAMSIKTWRIPGHSKCSSSYYYYSGFNFTLNTTAFCPEAWFIISANANVITILTSQICNRWAVYRALYIRFVLDSPSVKLSMLTRLMYFNTGYLLVSDSWMLIMPGSTAWKPQRKGNQCSLLKSHLVSIQYMGLQGLLSPLPLWSIRDQFHRAA